MSVRLFFIPPLPGEGLQTLSELLPSFLPSFPPSFLSLLPSFLPSSFTQQRTPDLSGDCRTSTASSKTAYDWLSTVSLLSSEVRAECARLARQKPFQSKSARYTIASSTQGGLHQKFGSMAVRKKRRLLARCYQFKSLLTRKSFCSALVCDLLLGRFLIGVTSRCAFVT